MSIQNHSSRLSISHAIYLCLDRVDLRFRDVIIVPFWGVGLHTLVRRFDSLAWWLYIFVNGFDDLPWFRFGLPSSITAIEIEPANFLPAINSTAW